jgi:hypothetical protein
LRPTKTLTDHPSKSSSSLKIISQASKKKEGPLPQLLPQQKYQQIYGVLLAQSD